jgi:serine/threonine protein kinase
LIIIYIILKYFRNIFLNGSDLVIGDLGHAKQFSNKTTEKIRSNKFGTLLYNAPETFVDDSYSNAIDIWSFGCVVFEMIKLERLFKNTSKISEFDVNIELNAKEFDSFFFTILKKYNLYS